MNNFEKAGKCILLLMLLFCNGCVQCVEPYEFLKYTENPDNGMRYLAKLGDWEYTVQYRHPDAQIIQENRSNSITKNEYETLRKKKASIMIFNFYLKHNTYREASPIRMLSNDMNQYSSLEDYLLNDAAKDFSLLTSKGALIPSVYNYEPNYNLAPFDVITVGFDYDLAKSTKANDSISLKYIDRLTGNGVIIFPFSVAKLNDIPCYNKKFIQE